MTAGKSAARSARQARKTPHGGRPPVVGEYPPSYSCRRCQTEGVAGGCGGGGGRVLPDSVVVFMCPEVLVKPCRRMRAKRITGIDRIAASRISEGVKRDRMLREELTHQPHRTKINTN
ncbi:hypothetical protein C0Q70_21728 [Pomacea canaliculata]|uniref:Uncharacterized protein n=1 Tax=Pomacea canaliculata TaxID=400727 RepID=A0A2T7NDB9_POMCA|nr:hypothetical protein C0Q70_21728 [Pomacea canaliculata]